ncbi:MULTISPECIES: glycosyltransferase family 4 protein [unclassified Ornithinimicrobium]|uniref:glycosyltransferase family 4 protein n=1 Tax=unclassified Ornithinimicrobium TaxID=2615080 RepID=UPI0038533631
MKVVHAVRSDAFAGVERHVVVLARAQAEQGDEIRVIGGDPHRMKVELGPDVPHLPARTTAEVGAALVRAAGADIVHTHMTAAETAAALALGGRPYVVTRHFAARRGRSWAGRLASPVLRQRAARQIAVSQFVAGAVDGRSTVVYAGVPNRPLSSARERVVLVCQRLEPEKDTALALEAFALSGLVDDGWRLVVAGTGSQGAQLRERAAQLGLLSDVDLLGFSEDVSALMDQASVLLATAPAEPFGLSVVEAMACGLPVVASAAGGHLESVGLVDGAALFSAGSAQDAAGLLRKAARYAPWRVAYGHRLQTAQRQRFTPDRQARETRSVYEELLG